MTAENEGEGEVSAEEEASAASQALEVFQTTGAVELAPPQWTAVEALVAGETVTDAAEEAEVTRQTVHRWMKKPDFRRALQFRKQEVVDAARQKLDGLSVRAVEVFREALEAGDRQAAYRLLKGTGALDGKGPSLVSREEVPPVPESDAHVGEWLAWTITAMASGALDRQTGRAVLEAIRLAPEALEIERVEKEAKELLEDSTKIIRRNKRLRRELKKKEEVIRTLRAEQKS